MIENNFSFSANESKGVLVLKNTNTREQTDLLLHCSLALTPSKLTGAKLLRQIGAYHVLALPNLSASAQHELVFDFAGKDPLPASYAPTGIFFTRAEQLVSQQQARRQLEQKLLPAPATAEPIWAQAGSARLAYRAFMLDVSRNFFALDTLKRLLKLIAYLGFNTLHLHLSNDEGWRLEIKAYPELTRIGGWRGHGLPLAPAFSSGYQRYGGYYSQAEIRELVSYANDHGVQIVPEISLPAHARAAIVALHPQLSEVGDTSSYLSVQGYKDNCLNPCLAATWEFIERVYGELAELFPAPYIHIGGDEIPVGVWQQSPAAAGRTREQILSSFYERLGSLLKQLGKTPIAWEEAAPWLNADAMLCHWQAHTPTPKHPGKLLLSQAPHFYLDSATSAGAVGTNWAGFCSLADIMQLKPIDANIYYGGQVNLWSEHIDSEQVLRQQLLPRLTAIAHYIWNGRMSAHIQAEIAEINSRLEQM